MSRNVLSRAQDFALMNLVQAEYVTSGLGDSAFARYATEKLGFVVNNSHVIGARGAFGLPINRLGGAPSSNLEARVAALEHLAKRFLVYIGEPTQ